MVIVLNKIINSTYSNDEGNKIFNLMRDTIKENSITISFEGFDVVSSSFVNSAFVPLLQIYSFELIKSHLHFRKTNRQINDMIKKRLVFESARANQ
jgi:hypothetical protein